MLSVPPDPFVYFQIFDTCFLDTHYTTTQFHKCSSVEVAGDGGLTGDLLLELHDSVHKRLGSRGTTRNIDIHRNDSITTAHDSVGIMVIAASIGT
jgi:hypothetical protein